MNIGLMCHSSCGGSARVATELSMALIKRGHAVHLFCHGRPFGFDVENIGVICHLLGNEKKASHPAKLHTEWTADEISVFVTGLIHSILAYRLDILHFHYALPFALIAMEIKQRLRAAAPLLVGTLHGTDVTRCRRDANRQAGLTRALGHIDLLTTVSKSHARLSTDVLGLERLPKVIPNFVDLSKFKPVSGSKRPAFTPRISHVSNFRPIKNTIHMADIFIEIKKSLDAELWLIGDGPQLGAVKKIFNHSSFNGDVKYFGMTRDVGALLNQTDLLLITSRYESFCLVALEAMACGVPVLASHVGGLPEVVEHGKTGFLFHRRDTKGAADFAGSLLTSYRHDAMRKAALKRARKFDIERITPLYEKLYVKHLKKKGSYDHQKNTAC